MQKTSNAAKLIIWKVLCSLYREIYFLSSFSLSSSFSNLILSAMLKTVAHKKMKAFIKYTILAYFNLLLNNIQNQRQLILLQRKE